MKLTEKSANGLVECLIELTSTKEAYIDTFLQHFDQFGEDVEDKQEEQQDFYTIESLASFTDLTDEWVELEDVENHSLKLLRFINNRRRLTPAQRHQLSNLVQDMSQLAKEEPRNLDERFLEALVILRWRKLEEATQFAKQGLKEPKKRLPRLQRVWRLITFQN